MAITPSGPRGPSSPLVSMFSVQWLVPVPEPGKLTWRPVTLCPSLVHFLHLRQQCFLCPVCCFCVPVDRFSMWIDLLQHSVCLCLLCTIDCFITAVAKDSPTTVWSGVYFHHLILVFLSLHCGTRLKKGTDFSIMASFKLDFLPEMMVDHCSLNSSPV